MDNKEKEKRSKYNKELIERLKQGEPLQDKSSSTWLPPRPIIKKDVSLVKSLYGENVKVVGEPEKQELKIVK